MGGWCIYALAAATAFVITEDSPMRYDFPVEYELSFNEFGADMDDYFD